MATIRSLTSFKLDLPPSCIEFFSLKPEFAVIGTYNLEKKPDGEEESTKSTNTTTKEVESKSQKSQQRNGSLILVQVDGDHVNILQNLSTPSAILDIHFLTHVPSSNFGVATSTGAFAIYELESWTRNPKIVHIKTIQYFPEDVLITAFTWHPESYMVGMTLSDGRVCLGVIDVEDEGKSEAPGHLDLVTHELEAWTLAFMPDGKGLMSGGDDSAIKMIELSDEPEEIVKSERYTPARYMSWSDKKIHGAGVTAILPLHVDDENGLVLTGSYDDHVRLLRVAAAGRREVLADMNLGGGVWRLKLLDRQPKLPAHHGVEKWRSEPPPTDLLLLVSCMHAGTRIVKLSKDGKGEWDFKVLAKFEEHKSMNYGSDSQPGVDGKAQRTFITTSFYDRLLCLWRF